MSYRDHDEIDDWELLFPEDGENDTDDDLDELADDNAAEDEFGDDDSEGDDLEFDDASSDEDLPEELPETVVKKRRSERPQRTASLHVLSEQEANACEDALGYQFRDRRKLEHGLTHSSIARTRLDSNERLEFLGDSIMGAVICESLYNLFPDLPEGELTRIKSAVVSRQTCAKVSKALDLGRFLLLGKGFSARERIPSSILAAVYESIVASIYLDGGYEAAKEFVLATMGDEVTKTAKSAHAQNFKSLLQQLAQKHYGQTPNYRVTDEKGPDHSKCFEIAVTIGSRVFPTAWGPNKKEAEQNAARSAIEIIAVEKDELFDQT